MTSHTTPEYADANLLQREPVALSAPAVALIVDALSGTGTNSHVAALAAGVLVLALRWIVTSPATAKALRRRAAITAR